MFGINKYIVGPAVDGLKNFNQTFATSAGITDAAEKTYTHFTKMVGASTGTAGLAKGAVDCAEALVCKDGLCAVVSGIGCIADGLTICTNFIPGPNVTTVVTVPVSVGCKTFVWACKRSSLPFGCRH